jgi:hypothetical protein
MMASFLYIHVEAITIHQWLGCTLIFFIHLSVNVTIFLFIIHLYHVCCNLLQLNHIVIQLINLSTKPIDFVNESLDLSMVLFTKLPLLNYGHHGIDSSFSSSYVSLSF